MSLNFPATPTVGQTFERWVWDSVKWTPLAIQISETPTAPACGLLSLDVPSESNTLRFLPFNGDIIRINGQLYRIPPAGVFRTGWAGTYVNGVANQALANSTTYFVYLFDNAGTLTMDFWASTNPGSDHATSNSAGNIGTETRQGDDTRTLIGLIRTRTTNAFLDNSDFRFLRSWFNRSSVGMYTTGEVGGPVSGITGTDVSSYFVAFRNEVALFSASASVTTANLLAFYIVQVRIDGEEQTSSQGHIPQHRVPLTTTPSFSTLTFSGLHEARVFYAVSGDTVGGPGGITGIILR